jgi:hypothetical protein
VNYLHFVTLNTGAVERTLDIEERATHPAALDLGRALRDGRAPIASRPAYGLDAKTAGRALLCTIYGPVGQPLSTIGVASRSIDAARLWEMMHAASAGYGLLTDPAMPPAVPWCAVRVEPALVSDIEAARWLAAYELEIAWAWIKRRHRDA